MLTLQDALTDVLAAGAVRAVYQPVVDLRTEEVVGYEALARGPEGTALESPGALFGAARDEGRLDDLELACRAAAFNGAFAGGLRPPLALFVNAEPDGGALLRGDTTELERRAHAQLRIVYEVTERHLTVRPAELLAGIEEVRAEGALVALDDVGADPRSLALINFIRPDIVKLDMSLVASVPDSEVLEIAREVRLYCRWAGATVLAEGIETEEHRRRALQLGAELGQGWFFGRPSALGEIVSPSRPDGWNEVERQPAVMDETPFEVISAQLPTIVGTKESLLGISIELERHAGTTSMPSVLLGCFQEARHFTPYTARRYARLAQRAAFVGAFGQGMPEEPAPGVRGARFPENHRLAGEWNVLVVGPGGCRALVARDLGDSGPDRQRRFEYAIVVDRDLVMQAARSLMLDVVAL